MDGEGDHLCDGWEAGDRAVVGRVPPVPALVDEHCPPFKEPVVLIVPIVRDSPLYHLLNQSKHSLLDGRAFLDGE